MLVDDADGPELCNALTGTVVEQIEIAAKYDGYISRQNLEIARHESHETTRIPPDFDVDTILGLSIEVRQKLKAHRPETVGQAARIGGVTPAAISLLLIFLKRWNKQTPQARTESTGDLAA
jgi:tRNA uridine 5-carboxymethylaminomethyl modification enzyme